jgi:hypothetical protein
MLAKTQGDTGFSDFVPAQLGPASRTLLRLALIAEAKRGTETMRSLPGDCTGLKNDLDRRSKACKRGTCGHVSKLHSVVWIGADFPGRAWPS